MSGAIRDIVMHSQEPAADRAEALIKLAKDCGFVDEIPCSPGELICSHAELVDFALRCQMLGRASIAVALRRTANATAGNMKAAVTAAADAVDAFNKQAGM